MSESTCSKQGCSEEPVADDLCRGHYTEAREALLTWLKSRKPSSPEIRFRGYADKSGGPDSCWPWTGTVEVTGYGNIFVNGSKPRLQKVHRWAYQHFVGPIPDGLEIDHTCHTKMCPTPGVGDPHRRCVNPRHLEAVTRSVNIQRSTAPEATRAYYRDNLTECPKGHAYTEANTQWRTTKTGYQSRRCATCNRENVARWKAAKFASGELSPEILATRERERQTRKRSQLAER